MRSDGQPATAEHSGRTPQPYLSKAAERAATSARPEGPSEESCRNKCRREERMLRAKRASSPDKLGLLDAALTSEQRSSTEQGVEQLICKAVLKQKRPRAAVSRRIFHDFSRSTRFSPLRTALNPKFQQKLAKNFPYFLQKFRKFC